METVVIAERDKSVLTDVIMVIIFAAVPLFFLLKWLFLLDDESTVFIAFLIFVVLFFPVVVVSGYIWDVKQEIILSETKLTVHYGRNIVDILHGEGRFSMISNLEIPWKNITGFSIESYDHREPAEGGGYSTFKKYSLIIKIKSVKKVIFNFEEFSNNYYGIGLAKFKESPDMVLEICERFQKNILNDNEIKKS